MQEPRNHAETTDFFQKTIKYTGRIEKRNRKNVTFSVNDPAVE